MAEYIDRDELYEQMHVMGMDVDLIEVLEVIENFPAEDVEHVVRCKDCWCLTYRDDGTHGCYRHFMDECQLDDFCSYGELRTAPVRNGRWVPNNHRQGFFMCSECGSTDKAHQPIRIDSWKFCPNCGAKMDG